MKLTKLERLNLINQYQILEKLDPNENYSSFIKALQEGYEAHYSDLVEWLYDDFPKDKSDFVVDVLEMYRRIIFSYNALDDKGDLNESRIKFHGFDGNNESSYLGYASYFINDLGRYDEIRNNTEFRDLNSHRPMIDNYMRKLSVWKSSLDVDNLTLEEIQNILNT
ncbi:YfbU family protein [Salipaludibacillus sp. CF4.18]|uniref:YfbU family protein n=1 Tax=Salipaludibacillus sp. CF4.18 TaxID=3373081 RepID=UPI003EE52F68